jgi:hypothetical protein
VADAPIQERCVPSYYPKTEVLKDDFADISLHDIFERLSNYDCHKAYRRRANRKFENTTQWILTHPDFVTWLNGEGPQCLWLSGIGSLTSHAAYYVVNTDSLTHSWLR